MFGKKINPKQKRQQIGSGRRQQTTGVQRVFGVFQTTASIQQITGFSVLQRTTDKQTTGFSGFRVFRVFQTTGKHTADYRVFSFAADNRQADNGFRFFQFFRFFRFFSVFSVFRFFRVFQTTGKHTTGFGFSAEFWNLQ
jgi:hypothetical protein